jgi:ABC-type branched-subunit amino acid transport system substrate-binding protein
MANKSRRRALQTIGGAAAGLALAPYINTVSAAPSGQPIRIGSTLALTGGLASTGIVHKLVGEIVVEQLNAKNGLLGRPVVWEMKDDQSKPDVTRTLYEQLITVDKVDFLLGPYATGGILSAMSVAERYNKVLIHHTFGIPSLAKYNMHFPAWALGPTPEQTVPAALFDLLQAQGKAPKSIAIVTSKFPSVHFLSVGARDVAKKRNVEEKLYLEWEFGNLDFGPIAARLKEANADVVWVGDIGLEAVQVLEACSKIGYTPKLHFHLYPAPGPTATSQFTKGGLATTVFEEHPPFTSNPVAADFVKVFSDRAAKANMPYPHVEVQAAVSFVAWQILQAGIEGAKTLDDAKVGAWLKANTVDSIIGKLRFNGPNNYGDDLTRIKQLQGADWKVVWPTASAAPGAKLQAM